MKGKLKLIGIMVLCVAMLAGLTACGSGKNGGNGGKTASGKIELPVWHSWGTKTAASLQSLVDDFNSSQDKYEAVLYNQGDTIRQKMTTLKKGEYPAIFIGKPSETCFYDHASYVKPLSDFLKEDSEDWTANIYENVKASYSNTDGEMVGVPFGTSSIGYFINEDLLKQAGYTTADLTSFEKMANIALEATKKGICKYGMSFYNAGLVVPTMMTIQGVDVVDQNNGFGGTATKSLLGEGETKAALNKFMDIFTNLYENKAAYAYASDTTGEIFPSFYNGSVLFCMATNSFSHYVVDNASFAYSFVPLTGLDESAANKNCAVSEGSGWYIADNGDEERMQGAYELVKFLASDESQAFWCSKLGYVPFTDTAAELPVYKDWASENFPSLVDLRETIKNSSTELRVPYTDIPDEMLAAFAELCEYSSQDPTGDYKGYIEDAIDTIDEGIEIAALRR